MAMKHGIGLGAVGLGLIAATEYMKNRD